MTEPKSRGRTANARPSILFSALLVVGMLLTLVGSVAALLGLGGSAQDAFSGLGLKISSAGPGLVIATLGVAVIYLATKKTRGAVRVFGGVQHSALDRMAGFAPWLLLAVLLVDFAALLWALFG
jgi:hypothetical protein